MAKNPPDKSPLILVDPTSSSFPPPRPFKRAGMTLWNAVQSEYVIRDAAGIELLAQCCEASDRVASCAEQIDRDGEIIQTRTGPKRHPALRDELAWRGFITKTLEKLGLDLEPVRAVGRPSGGRQYGD
jgi:hypothetical protein